jgi:hypothetical protein
MDQCVLIAFAAQALHSIVHGSVVLGNFGQHRYLHADGKSTFWLVTPFWLKLQFT